MTQDAPTLAISDTLSAEQYRQRGFVGQAYPLADPSIVPALLADEAKFAVALEAMRVEGRHGVPYMLTDAICRVAEDAAIVGIVEAILGTSEWVMWGANIRRGTPNQAHTWHVDLESFLWTTVTVAIGLASCAPASATWFTPGTHLSGKGPPSNEAAVVAHGCPEHISGFGNARFYVFDARTWHRGDPTTSCDRVVLFIHYQRADQPRIPLMLDYDRQLWAREPSPYFTTMAGRRLRAEVAGLPWWYRLKRWKIRMRGRQRIGLKSSTTAW